MNHPYPDGTSSNRLLDRLQSFFQSGKQDQSITTPLEITDTLAASPELQNIKLEKNKIRQRLIIGALFKDELKGMVDSIDQSDVILVLTDLAVLSGEDYELIHAYLQYTAKERKILGLPFAVIPVHVTSTPPSGRLSDFQKLPRDCSIADTKHANVGLNELSNGIRSLRNSPGYQSIASPALAIVCSPENHTMFTKVASHLLAAGLIDNKYYRSGFRFMHTPVQQGVLDEYDKTSCQIDATISNLMEQNPSGDIITYIEKAFGEHPDTQGIIENIQHSDIILLGMHTDLLGKRWYRLLEQYLKHVYESRKQQSKPLSIIPIKIGTCTPDTRLNRFAATPSTALDISPNAEKAFTECGQSLERVVQAFVETQGHKQLNCFPLYNPAQLQQVDILLNQLKASGLVSKDGSDTGSHGLKILETAQMQTIKSQSAHTNKNKLLQFNEEMMHKIDTSDLILLLVDAQTLSTQEYDLLESYYISMGGTEKSGKKVVPIYIHTLGTTQINKVASSFGGVYNREPLQGKQGFDDGVATQIVGGLSNALDKNTIQIQQGVLIMGTTTNKSACERIKTHLSGLIRRRGLSSDYLHI